MREYAILDEITQQGRSVPSLARRIEEGDIHLRRGDGSDDDIHGWMTRFVGFGDDFLGRRTEAGSAYVVGRGHAESILGKRSKIGKNVTGILGIRGEDLLSGRWLVRLPLGPRRSAPPPRIVAISAVSGVVTTINVTSSSDDGATVPM